MLAVGPAKNGTDAEQNLSDGEWLRDIIVGTEVEPRYLVVLRSLCREENDWDVLRHLIAAELLCHSKSAHAAHHDVEQNELVILGRHSQCVFT